MCGLEGRIKGAWGEACMGSTCGGGQGFWTCLALGICRSPDGWLALEDHASTFELPGGPLNPFGAEYEHGLNHSWHGVGWQGHIYAPLSFRGGWCKPVAGSDSFLPNHAFATQKPSLLLNHADVHSVGVVVPCTGRPRLYWGPTRAYVLGIPCGSSDSIGACKFSPKAS